MAAISQILIVALIIISACVVRRLAKDQKAWDLIIAYWVVLTVKNCVDLLSKFI